MQLLTIGYFSLMTAFPMLLTVICISLGRDLVPVEINGNFGTALSVVRSSLLMPDA